MTIHADLRATRVLPLVAAAMFGLVTAPLPAPAKAATVAVRLCGGGVLHLDLGGGQKRGGTPGACHATCVMRRDDDGEKGIVSLP